MRMRTDVFTSMSIKEDKPDTTGQLQISFGEERTHLNSSGEVKSPSFENTDSSVGATMVSCDDCGLVFDSTHDLQRHIKRWCPENDNGKRKLPLDNYEESLGKKPRVLQSDEYVMNCEDGSPNTSTEEYYFKRLRQRSLSENEDACFEKYQNDGLSKKEAEERADNKIKKNQKTISPRF